MITPDTMRAGLDRGEFFLEYLPTVSLTDRRCTGGEALIRWRRATGIVPPGDFIPVAENTPVSGLITYWVMDNLLAEMGDWLRANRDAHISFNVPPEIVGRGGLEYSAKKSGFWELRSQVVVEITERGLLDLLGIETINSWDKDIRFALDDFTFAGGAKLAVLSRSNINIIKLDMSLVSQISPQRPAPEWLGGITALLQSSRLEIIAEGVETEHQALTLRRAGVQNAQGFLFSRPIPAAAFIAYHRETQHLRPNQPLRQVRPA